MQGDITMNPYTYKKSSAVPFSVHNTCATEAEVARATAAYAALLSDLDHFPCSFAIDGQFQSGLSGFEVVDHTHTEEARAVCDTLTLRHASGLCVTVVTAHYPECAAYEWTLYFENRGSADSPRINDLSGADLLIPGKKPRLRGIRGDARNESYGDGILSPSYGMNNQPYDMPLALGQLYDLRPVGGCACNHEFPYFKMQTSLGSTMVAIGWPGQWRARFLSDPTGIRFRAGQELMDTTLRPGESMRTPLITVLLADGDDPDRLSNLWRRFMLECNMPRQNGEVLPPMISATSTGTDMMVRATEDNQIRQIRNYRAHGVHLDHWWMDAGWYEMLPNGKSASEIDGYVTDIDDYVFLGSWQMRDRDFPTHLRAVSDCMAEEGGRTMLWFEPERVGIPLEYFQENDTSIKPEWFLSGVIPDTRYRSYGALPHPIRYVDLGNPEARQWITDRICTYLREGNIAMYREDHNITPLMFFRQSDEPGRWGMAENHYMTGHLKMWDDIRAEFGDMILDSCASGGRRNDLESMRRAVPLHVSDYFITSKATLPHRQAVMSSLFAYFPYFKQEGPEASGIVDDDFEWYMATAMTPFSMIHVKEDTSEADWARVRAHFARWEQIKYTFYADYYPLTEWNYDSGEWLAYQFMDSVTGVGSVIAYRRGMNDESAKILPLKGLMSDKTYRVTDLTSGESTTTTGLTLATDGLTVNLPNPLTAAILKITCAD